MTELQDRYERGHRQYGEQWDPAEMDACPHLHHAYNTSERVEVVRQYPDGNPGEPRRGRVSTTTGWRPAFVLVHRSSDHGSADLLTTSDRIVAVQRGRTYVPLANLSDHDAARYQPSA